MDCRSLKLFAPPAFPIATAAVVALAALAGASGAGAAPQSPAPTPPPAALTWADVVAALDAHPALRAAAAEVEQAAGEVAAARQYPNPGVGASVGRAEALEGPESARVWELEVALPILWPGVRGRTIAAARAEQEAAVHEAAALRLETRRRLGEQFWRVVHDQERLASLARSAAQVDTLVQVARLRVEMGEARPLELARLEVEAARVAAGIEQAAATARARKRTLNLWLGSRLPEGYQVEGDLLRLPTLAPLPAAGREAASRHPEALAAVSRLRAASARVGAERGARLPDLAVGAFWERELDARAWGGRLELSLPLWNWNSGGVARARAAEAAARHRRDLVETGIAAAILEAHAAAEGSLARARALQLEVLPRAETAAAALESMYRVGEVGITDVLDARRELIAARDEMLEAHLEARLAHLELLTLTGEESDE